MDNGRLEVVYASDHNYMFFCCVSILSLMEHLPSEKQVRLHLLIDESFCREDERLLEFLNARFANLEIVKHPVMEEAFEQRDFKDSIWSKATCYRLILPELLKDVDLCVYLDSDTLIVGDVMPLWETDMSQYALAGVFIDIAPVRTQTVGESIPGIESYISAGVLVMNLALMRKRGIQEKTLAGVSDYLLADQDLLNVACYGAIRLIPPDYNCIPGVHSDTQRILHFLMRDYLRPWKNRRCGGADEWWRCAREFEGVYDLEALRSGAYWYERGSISCIFRRCADYERVYVVGSGTDAERIFRALRLGKCKGLQGVIGEEESLEYAPDIFLIVASRKGDIIPMKSFLSHDGAASQVFSFSRWPIAFYNLVPDCCRREVYGELLMWEFGVDTRNAVTCPYLLELNAARYPDREALVEWKGSRRLSCSYRELNRMANRMADWIRQNRWVRGGTVTLPCSLTWNIELFAAMLGILKSGCVALIHKDPDGTGAGKMAQETMHRVDLSALFDPGFSHKAPTVQVLPQGAAAIWDASADESVHLTQRDLCSLAENLRRRCGWYQSDRLLVVAPSFEHGLIELLAAFACGNTMVIAPYSSEGQGDFDSLLEVAGKEKCTIIGMGESAFVRAAKEAEDWAQRESRSIPLGCRLILAGDTVNARGNACSSRMRNALERWQHAAPHVPVNGQGYAGSFRYDCEWY